MMRKMHQAGALFSKR